MVQGVDLQKVANILWSATETGTPVPPVRDMITAGGVDAAYEVQEINTKRRLEAGSRLVGRKIGLTSRAVQKQLNVDQPDYGMLFADMAMPDGLEIPVSLLMQAKVEAEVAFVMGRDLNTDQPTVADLFRAIDYAVPAIEIVGSRIGNWDIKIFDTIADNASAGLYVLGNEPVVLPGLNLRTCRMAMIAGGENVSTGTGEACLGHPLNATLWLAQMMAKVGRPLRAGDTVLSGALGPMVPVKPGTVYEAEIQGLGSVRAAFAKE